MKIEVGTLQEIGAKVGDVVELVAWGLVWNKYNDHARGKHYTVGEDRLDRGGGYFMIGDAHGRDKRWRIISRAKQSPVREVTRKEIVPGVYGKVSVKGPNGASVGLCFVNHSPSENGHYLGHAWLSKYELTDAINMLTQIRDAMADYSATSCGALE